MGDGLCELFADDYDFRHASDADDLFSILETWEDCVHGTGGAAGVEAAGAMSGAGQKGKATRRDNHDGEEDGGIAPVQKKHKCSSAAGAAKEGAAAKMSHVTVERNRRKQMNEHLAALRSLMPCFYVKRGDQASIIGGVVDYIKELQQVLQSLEAKKQRKAYADQVLSPRPASSPRIPLSPRPPVKSPAPPPLSPRLALPISPRTPTPGSPYKPRVPPAYVSPAMTPTHESSPQSYLPTSTLDAIAIELAAYVGKPAATAGLPDVKVEFSGPNLVLKTVSHRVPGQAAKIVAALEGLSMEILHASITTVDDTMVNSFTIKIGIECELSAEELVQEILQTFL